MLFSSVSGTPNTPHSRVITPAAREASKLDREIDEFILFSLREKE
jgi:hypothetical protein